MKLWCTICTEYCVITDEISATSCGHLFHAHCLNQWLQQNYTCPQCRNRLARSNGVINKIYFEPGPEPRDEENVDELKNRLNDVEAQLMSATVFVNECNERDRDSQKQIAIFKQNAKETNDKYLSIGKQFESLKQQSLYLVNDNKALNEVRLQNELLTAKIKDYDMINKLINESSMEIEQSFKDALLGTSGKQWSVMCGVLKKTLNQSNSENQQLKVRIKNLSVEHNKLKKMLAMKNQIKSPNCTSSPIAGPSSKATNGNASYDSFDDNKVSKDGKENVPFKLPLKSRSTAAMVANLDLKEAKPYARKPDFLGKGHTMYPIHDFNIMKRRGGLKSLGSKGPTGESAASQGYNGLGGHSKPDVFPTGKKPH